MSNKELNERLWEQLPVAPIPNLEEMKIAAGFKRHWDANSFEGTPEQVAELAYRKGRQDGKAIAMEEILGRKR